MKQLNNAVHIGAPELQKRSILFFCNAFQCIHHSTGLKVCNKNYLAATNKANSVFKIVPTAARVRVVRQKSRIVWQTFSTTHPRIKVKWK